MYDRKSFTKTLEAVQDYMSLDENTVSAEIDMMHKNKDTTAEQGPGEAKKYLHKIGGPSIKVTKYTHSGSGGGHPSVKFSGHVKHVMKAINNHEDEKYSHDMDGHKEYKKDFGESVNYVGEERTVDSGKAQHMLAPSERAMHAKHMMDRHGVKTKFHGKDEVSYHGPLPNVKRALSNHYGGDISQAKDLHPIMMKNESVENVDENIISRMLPGAHGRYMKKLKVAHDHHKMMEKGHLDLEKKIDPSLGNNPKDDADTDRQYEHGKATQEHGRAAEAIRKLAVHAKANKLTGHPTKGAGKEFHISAIGRSKEAHYDSNNAIKYDERYHDHPHMDHTQKLKKSLGKYHSDDHTHHKSLS